jgi:Bacterial PH domain/zinc-ribbon domain
MESPPKDLMGILGPNEQIQLYIQEKIYHPRINVDSIVITNERIILRHPHSLGLKKDYTDFSYQDVANVVLKKGFLRSALTCTLRFRGEPLLLDDLPNSDAQKAYGTIRENLVRYQSPFTAASAPRPSPTWQPAPSPGFSASSCRKCGSQLVPGQKFCGSCGQPIA